MDLISHKFILPFQEGFQDSNAHIAFTASYLQGITFDHYTALLQFKPQNPALSNWQSFIDKFSSKFGVFDTVAETEDNLFNLKMRPEERFTTFIIRFEKEACKTGWNYSVLRYALCRALPQRIKDVLQLAPKQPLYEGYKTLVMQVNQHYWEDHSEYNNAQTQWNPRKSWQAGTTNGSNNPRPPAPPATPGVQPPFVRNLGPNNQTLGPRPPAQLNASDILKALEPSPDKSTDPNALLDDPALPDNEEALRASCFRGMNKPWIDVPLDVQER
ncbi:hypothetical protein C0992_007231 [Termitomyces sp. T32_za158]|nr:hypothetical protein C0992_007231 [Termitomyces sp. T32_za158]